MTCKEQVRDLVECARRGSQPGRELRAHIASCAGCQDRWEAERQLTDLTRHEHRCRPWSLEPCGADRNQRSLGFRPRIRKESSKLGHIADFGKGPMQSATI